ncbi:MAG: glycosyltransferase family A protein [Pseudomonadota bacterium]
MTIIDEQPAQKGEPDISTPIGETEMGEGVLSNGVPGEATLTICVPAYKDSADALLASLIRLDDADQCTLLIFDDGSQNADLTRILTQQILRFPGPARLITSQDNMGRAHARNRLIALAETDWILFLDADMHPDSPDFLSRYLAAATDSDTPSLIPGGFSLKHAHPTDETRLHAAQSLASECVDASVRARQPGRYVFTSNILVHREILETVQFDDAFKGWGWEDVDWGLRIAEQYPITHIDNPATHLGLDSDDTLMAKYSGSSANFARVLQRHPDALKQTPLYKASRFLSRMPGRSLLKAIAGMMAKRRFLPIKVRLYALKLYRASAYAGAV